MSKDEFLDLLRKKCESVGGQKAWAAENGMSAPYVSDVLAGKRDPGVKIASALGFERVVVYQKARTSKE